MNQLKYILPLFAIMVIAQIYVPTQMIWQNEHIIHDGTEYHFRTAPVDPTDPFRGKYITLNYLDDQLEIKKELELHYDDEVYVTFSVNEDGFAIPESASKEKPLNNSAYLKTSFDYISISDLEHQKVAFSYDFNRFYMEESKAYAAEKFYQNANRDTAQEAYAVVYLYDGDAVVNDVMIDGVSIVDLVEE